MEELESASHGPQEILSQMAAQMPSMSPKGEPRRVAEDGSVGWRFGTAVKRVSVVVIADDHRHSMVETETKLLAALLH